MARITELQYAECFGALSRQKTYDESATRRYGAERDEDSWMNYGGHFNFSIDAHNKISPSKAFRRLSHKTQVFTKPTNMHVRSRLTHTLEVASLAVSVARVLGLNQDLCFAIALGHDLGHTPFGHDGEKKIAQLTGKKFSHAVFSVVVAQKIEREGRGLNLTKPVLEGMLRHSKGVGTALSVEGMSAEAAVVRQCDHISYLFSDSNDVARNFPDLFKDHRELMKLMSWFGRNQRLRVQACLMALCVESAQKGKVVFEETEEAKGFNRLKKYFYDDIYPHCHANYDTAMEVAFHCMQDLVPDVDPAPLFALLTDEDAIRLAIRPKLSLDGLSVSELVPFLRKNPPIDWQDPDLNW